MNDFKGNLLFPTEDRQKIEVTLANISLESVMLPPAFHVFT